MILGGDARRPDQAVNALRVIGNGVELDFQCDLFGGFVDFGNQRLAGLNEALFLQANPIPVKWALQERGLIGAGIRLPLTTLDEQYQAAVVAAMEAAGV